ELRWVPVDHRGIALGRVIGRSDIRGVHAAVETASLQFVVAQACTPVGVKLIRALHVPARLVLGERTGDGGTRGVEGQVAFAMNLKPLGDKLEVLILIVA